MNKSKRHADGYDYYKIARKKMVQEQLIVGGIKDKQVLSAMEKVPRHLFVSAGMEEQAYFDRSLHIGERQTISQPIMVAIMTELLELNNQKRILEIGTGSGYQTAVLAELAGEVYTIERIQSLSVGARKVLYKLKYKNIFFRVGDGTLGWKEKAPFDGIIVTAGAPVVPEQLREQLCDGGRLIIPVGGEETQELLCIQKNGNEYTERKISKCRFVKLIGEEGW
ncbi:MAG: protein-L-isoaspartate O-methyltransferase [Deltaproteobacteria bacterium CG_4_10_14_0_2_um_filter_43_8]|nr:MAG: protein-L-isoaspartate O-methyltransferase [Deltaproteobacteria bacterium CG11_big_fil_rev_8_21_14_0_20_42_23]PJA22382.1 MAG: protein-L-isoaspartate O-methyltransferase [Deltaproteobacteria bacterium CG_4_10_14_0_2_um_filter_43_8]PJC64412.1 MAG: protein-L-isoaspartate O-methyltransferase [Deltaproteobacteria bacterium CG_4_9_14_0_2_um_filter_42_21]